MQVLVLDLYYDCNDTLVGGSGSAPAIAHVLKQIGGRTNGRAYARTSGRRTCGKATARTD